MASSSVSQDDVEVDFEIVSRRSRIRTARARNINPPPPPRTGEKFYILTITCIKWKIFKYLNYKEN